MIDASHCKVHPYAAGARGGNQCMSRTKGGGLNTKVHLVVDAHGMPPRVVVMGGARADCAEDDKLIDGFQMAHLLADKGCDSVAGQVVTTLSGCRWFGVHP